MPLPRRVTTEVRHEYAQGDNRTVYALVDPRSNRVRYIGATTQTLKVRLNGHLQTPVRRVKAWVDDLAADGLTPQILPIKECVPEADLRDLERAEIARRLIAGESLLNESATAPARKHIERRREQERIERERAAWEHVANQVRTVVGGPLAPGDVPPIPLNRQSLEAYDALIRTEDEPDLEVISDPNLHLTKSTRLHLARGGASDVLWQSVQPMWGRLRGMVQQHFDDVLAGRVGTVFEGRWRDLRDAARYLALLPWGIMAVGPWAALAERAGMDTAGSAFIDWVSDDITVREALHVLLVRSGGRMGPLSALDNVDNFSRPSTGLVAMTAAHHPGFDLPQVLNLEMRRFLESMLRDGQLTPAMADLLLKLDPHALDNILGPDITAAIDVQLGLPSGTSRNVLTTLLEGPGRWHLGNLDRIVARAAGALPTVEAPDFSGWVGNTVPMLHAITGALMAAGTLTAPAGKTPAECVSEVRALWCADLSVLERIA